MPRFILACCTMLFATFVFCVSTSSSDPFKLQESLAGVAGDLAIHDRLLDSSRLQLISDRKDESFQLELRWTERSAVANESPRTIRMVCESDGTNLAMLMLTDRGAPYAYIGKEGLYVLDSGARRSVLYLEGIRFAWEVGRKGVQAHVFINNTLERSQCDVDLSRVVRAFLANDHTIQFSPAIHQCVIAATNSRRMTVHWSREATPASFPIRTLAAVGGQEKTDWESTNFQRGPAIVRSILNMEPLFERHLTIKRCEADSAQPVIEALPWPDYKKFAHLFADAEVMGASAHLGAHWRTKWPAHPEIVETVETALARITQSLAKPDEQASAEILAQLNDLYTSTLQDTLCSAEIRTAEGTTWTAGRDPNRGALRAEATLSPPLQNKLYDVLADVVCAPRLSDRVRLRALDVLGELGLPDSHPALQRISADVEKQQGLQLKRMLATVRIRLLDYANSDIELLRNAIGELGTPDDLRALYFESLFLAGATAGLGEDAGKLLERGKPSAELAKRCRLALACSEEGRGILVAALKIPTDPFLTPERVLSLLSTRVARTDSQWPELLPELKKLSLDRASSPATRIAAATMAGQAVGEEQFRTQLMRQAIDEENRELTECAVRYHLSQLPEALVFLDDANRHFKSSGRFQQLLLIGILGVRSTAPIPPKYDASVRQFLRTVEQTNDPVLQDIGKSIADRLDAQ